MAHGIDDTSACFIRDLSADRADDAIGTDSWHGLGNRVRFSQTLTQEETLQLAGWTWTMSEDRAGRMVDGNFLPDPDGDKYIIRDDTGDSLGIVGKNYTALQFADAFDTLSPWIDSGYAKPEAAGLLHGGRYSWMQLRILDPVEIVPGDEYNRFLFFMQGHCSNLSVKLGTTDVRTVCRNTCRAAIKEGNLVDVKHTKKVKRAVSLIAAALDTHAREFSATVAELRAMATMGIRESDLTRYFRIVAKGSEKSPDFSEDAKGQTANKNLALQMQESFDSAPGAELAYGTLYGAFQAVTHWASHVRTVKNTVGTIGMSEAEKRQKQMWLGGNSGTLNYAYALALEWMRSGGLAGAA